MSPTIRFLLVVLLLLYPFLAARIDADYPPPSEDRDGTYSRPVRNPSSSVRQVDEFHRMEFGGDGVCLDLPANLTLCRGIGYSHMTLPNLFGHDTLGEVLQQASSWVMLVNIQCHTDTQIFLCSMFAPVCLDRPILPCRSLCEAVKTGCEDRMLSYGYPWPDLLRCDQFPADNDMCIKPRGASVTDVVTCPACSHNDTYDSILNSFCSAEFGASSDNKIATLGPSFRSGPSSAILPPATIIEKWRWRWRWRGGGRYPSPSSRHRRHFSIIVAGPSLHSAMKMKLTEGIVSGSDLKVTAAKRRKVFKASGSVTMKQIRAATEFYVEGGADCDCSKMDQQFEAAAASNVTVGESVNTTSPQQRRRSKSSPGELLVMGRWQRTRFVVTHAQPFDRRSAELKRAVRDMRRLGGDGSRAGGVCQRRASASGSTGAGRGSFGGARAPGSRVRTPSELQPGVSRPVGTGRGGKVEERRGTGGNAGRRQQQNAGVARDGGRKVEGGVSRIGGGTAAGKEGRRRSGPSTTRPTTAAAVAATNTRKPRNG